VRLLTYNIHKGWSLLNRQFVLERMRLLIREAEADVVFLQEVQGEHRGHARSQRDWPAEPQFEFLADTLWPHFAYGRNALYDDGHHGNAILSRFPFVTHENIDVSNNRLERRGLLHGTIAAPGWREPLHLVCLHLDLFERGRRRQAERLCERVEQHVPRAAPLVIAGDFNDWRGTVGGLLERRLGLVDAHKTLHGGHARTFPSAFPLLRLDRIYLRGLRPRAAICPDGEQWRALSDHCPLLAEVEP
jgi:endonuclease/exonuclease/phosphatase family metal-dependent hydrolase